MGRARMPDLQKRPVRVRRRAEPALARPRPGARSARRDRWPRHWTADRLLEQETPTMWFLSRIHPRKAGRKLARGSRFLPRLESLEDRTVPSTLTVLNNLDSGA